MADAAEPQGQPQPFPPDRNSGAEPVEVRPEAVGPAPVRPLIVRQIQTPATIVLAGINIAVFAAMVLIEGGNTFISPSSELLVKWGANFGPLTSGGQPWRMLTSMFLHVGIIHIGMNMWALWQLGILVERFYGTGRFLILYLLTGIAGSCASLLHNPFIAGAGASGAIFGILGALLSFATLQKQAGVDPRYHRIQISVLKCIAINFAIGLSIPQIDNSAHLGGLVSGVLMGAILAPVPIRGFPLNERLRAWLGTALFTAILAGGTVLAFSRAQSDENVKRFIGQNSSNGYHPSSDLTSELIDYTNATKPLIEEGLAIRDALTKAIAKDDEKMSVENVRALRLRAESYAKSLELNRPKEKFVALYALLEQQGSMLISAARGYEDYCQSGNIDSLSKSRGLILRVGDVDRQYAFAFTKFIREIALKQSSEDSEKENTSDAP